MEFSERLKVLRKESGKTQAELAEIIGITDRGYRKFESGENDPGMKSLVSLADFFGVTLDYLVGRSDDHRMM